MPKPKVLKSWATPHIEAKCLDPLCEQGPWVADGSWPMAAASNHTRASGHRTRAISTAEVTYAPATPSAADEPEPTSAPSD